MSVRVKICGLTREIDVACAIQGGADYLGFIVACESPRRLTLSRAAKLSRPAKASAKTVAVTVNPSVELCQAIEAQMQPDYLQVHGTAMTPNDIIFLKSKTNLKIIRALSVKTKADLSMVSWWDSAADAILLDAPAPKGSAQAGGHGVTFDWSLAKSVTSKRPIFLAGGLNPNNARLAAQSGFRRFDVSSGLESAPGIKDPAKIHAFMKALREASF